MALIISRRVEAILATRTAETGRGTPGRPDNPTPILRRRNRTSPGVAYAPPRPRRIVVAAATYSLPPSVRLHDLRHTAATLSVAAGESITFVQGQRGQTTINTTRYAHPDHAARRQAAERVAMSWREAVSPDSSDGSLGELSLILAVSTAVTTRIGGIVKGDADRHE